VEPFGNHPPGGVYCGQCRRRSGAWLSGYMNIVVVVVVVVDVDVVDGGAVAVVVVVAAVVDIVVVPSPGVVSFVPNPPCVVSWMQVAARIGRVVICGGIMSLPDEGFADKVCPLCVDKLTRPGPTMRYFCLLDWPCQHGLFACPLCFADSACLLPRS
jgi:hypothetical protein